jgi:hypothetical protein
MAEPRASMDVSIGELLLFRALSAMRFRTRAEPERTKG